MDNKRIRITGNSYNEVLLQRRVYGFIGHHDITFMYRFKHIKKRLRHN